MTTSFHLSEHGRFYAKIPDIVALPIGDPCPLLRTILVDDLACGEITEVEGEGDVWWHIVYRDTRFSFSLYLESCGGSELDFTSGSDVGVHEKEVLEELASKITYYAQKRKTA